MKLITKALNIDLIKKNSFNVILSSSFLIKSSMQMTMFDKQTLVLIKPYMVACCLGLTNTDICELRHEMDASNAGTNLSLFTCKTQILGVRDEKEHNIYILADKECLVQCTIGF